MGEAAQPSYRMLAEHTVWRPPQPDSYNPEHWFGPGIGVFVIRQLLWDKEAHQVKVRIRQLAQAGAQEVVTRNLQNAATVIDSQIVQNAFREFTRRDFKGQGGLEEHLANALLFLDEDDGWTADQLVALTQVFQGVPGLLDPQARSSADDLNALMNQAGEIREQIANEPKRLQLVNDRIASNYHSENPYGTSYMQVSTTTINMLFHGISLIAGMQQEEVQEQAAANMVVNRFLCCLTMHVVPFKIAHESPAQRHQIRTIMSALHDSLGFLGSHHGEPLIANWFHNVFNMAYEIRDHVTEKHWPIIHMFELLSEDDEILLHLERNQDIADEFKDKLEQMANVT